MRRQRMQLTCMLIKADDVPGVWCSWCPEVDVISQGDSPSEAIGMVSEAIQMVLQDVISAGQWKDTGGEDYEWVRQRVMHPLRLGKLADKADEWPEYVQWRDREPGKWRNTTTLSPAEFADGQDPIGFVTGDVSWAVVGGVPLVGAPDFYDDMIEVPARAFKARVRRWSDYPRTLHVRASLIDDDRMDAAEVARDLVKRDLRDGEELVELLEEKR